MSDKSEIIVGEPFELGESVSYSAGSVVSRTILKRPAGTITLFAFAIGEELSEHTAPFDAFVSILDGEAEVSIGGTLTTLRGGQSIVMPANVPHAIKATNQFKMMLVMIRS